MQLIKTKSFKLAVYSSGNITSETLALVLPGKLDTKDYFHMRSHVDYLAKLGYFALSFDPPGTWESPGDISLYTMTNYLKAVDELIEYYRNKPTFIMGHSRGASVATIAGARNNQIFAFAAIMSPMVKSGYTEQPDDVWKTTGYKISKRDLPPGGGPKVKEFKLPYSFFEDQQAYELSPDITGTKKPKLFIYGKHDVLATPETIKNTFTLFAQPKKLVALDSGHSYRRDPQQVGKVNDIVGKFLSSF